MTIPVFHFNVFNVLWALRKKSRSCAMARWLGHIGTSSPPGVPVYESYTYRTYAMWKS